MLQFIYVYFSLIITYIRLQMLSKLINRNLKISTILQWLNCSQAQLLYRNIECHSNAQQLNKHRMLNASMGLFQPAYSFHSFVKMPRRKQDKIGIFDHDLQQPIQSRKKELSFEQKIKTNPIQQLKDIKSKFYGDSDKEFYLQNKIQQAFSTIIKMKDFEKDQIQETIRNYANQISSIIKKPKTTQSNPKIEFQAHLSAINQLKSAAIGLYDIESYSDFLSLCDQIVILSKGICTEQFNLISGRIFQIYSQISIDLNKSQENSQKSEMTKQKALELASRKINNRDLSILVSNFKTVPAQQKELILQVLLLKIKHLSPTIITIFMGDCISRKQNLSIGFLQKFYAQVSAIEFLNSYRYFYLSFIGYFSEKCKYQPLYYPIQRYRKFIPFGISLSLSQIEAFTKLVTKEIQIAFTTQTQYWAYEISRFYLILMSQYSEKKLSLQKFIPIYNEICRIQPIGFWMAKYLDRGYYVFKVTQNNKKEVKLFIRNLMKNFEPDYIYSLQEVSIKEVGPQLISLVFYLSQKIIVTQPQFLFEIKNIFNESSKFSREIVYQAIQKLFSELKISIDGISVVFDSEESAQNLDDLERSQKVKQFFKLLSILHNNNKIHVDQLFEFSNDCFNQVMNSKSIAFRDQTLYEFLYNVARFVQLYENSESQRKLKAQKIFNRFCIPYLKNAILEKNVSIIKPSRKHQIDILLIASLSQPTASPEIAKLLVTFINERFIYTVKSVIKSNIFQIFSLFDSLPGINPEMYGYLLANLSSFIIYEQNYKKFYVKQGPNRRYQKKFVQIIQKMAKNFETLRLIENKDRLNTISLIFTLFWNRLSNVQIAQLMIIIGQPSYLSSKLYMHLAYVKFFKQDLESLGKYSNILANFKMINKSLMGILDKISSTEVEDRYLTSQLTDQKSQSEIKVLFQHLETYEEALQNKAFTNEHFIPPPVTTSERIKMIYVCLKILAKIRKHRNYDLLHNMKAGEISTEISNKIPPPIDFRQQIQYIEDNNLINRQKNNQFKMSLDLSQSHYEVIECWNKYAQDNVVHLQEYTNFIDSGVGSNSFFEKVILSFTGNYGLVKILMNKEPIFSDLCLELDNKDIPYDVKGGIISIGEEKGQLEGNLLVFVSSSQYSKLNLILCYIMQQRGSKVFHLFNRDQRSMKIQTIGQYLQKCYKQIISKGEIFDKLSEQIGYFDSFEKGGE